MPTYQYACTACDERLEAVQSFTDAALTTCPVCGGTLRKVFSAVGVVFKGSGFYKNDSRDSGKKGSSTPSTATEGSSTPAAATTSASSSSSSDSSPSSTPAPAAAPKKSAPAASTPSKTS